MVSQLYCVCAFCNGNGDHTIADKNDISFASIYICAPVAVLRHGGVEQAVAVTMDRAYNVCVREGADFPNRCGQNVIALSEGDFVQNPCLDGHIAFFICFAGKADLHKVAGDYIGNSDALRNGVGFVEQFLSIKIYSVGILLG